MSPLAKKAAALKGATKRTPGTMPKGSRRPKDVDAKAVTIASLADHKIWFPWPSSHNKTTRRQNRMTRAEAEKHVIPGPNCAFGIWRGKLGDGYTLAEISLDECGNRRTGKIARWAREIIDLVESYCEISIPWYRTALSIMFLIHDVDVPAIQKIMGVDEDYQPRSATSQDGSRNSYGSKRGMDVSLSGPAAFTNKPLPDSPHELRVAPKEDVLNILEHLRPKVNGRKPKPPKPSVEETDLADEARALGIAKLKSSGLTIADAENAGLEFWTAKRTTAHISFAGDVPHLVFPYWQPLTTPPFGHLAVSYADDERFRRIRWLTDPGLYSDGDPIPKYLQPSKSGVHAYFPVDSGIDWKTVFEDVGTPIIITEGELKALCGCVNGRQPVIALGGVWSFRNPKGDLLDDLAAIPWQGRKVFICYDSDYYMNRQIRVAQRALTRLLRKHGATVFGAPLPVQDGGAKVGLDDWLVAQGKKAASAFVEFLNQAPEMPPEIEIHNGEQSLAADAAEAALIESDLSIYSFGSRVVRVIDGRIVEVTEAAMTDLLSRAVTWVVTKAPTPMSATLTDDQFVKTREIDVPAWLPKIILSRDGKFTRLKGITRVPTLRPDGSVLADPGYDGTTALLYHPDPGLSIDASAFEAPTKDDAERALKLFTDLLVETEFEDDTSRSVALHMIVAAVLRPAMPVSPIFVVTAPQAGSGKSYLVRVASIIATGEPPAVVPRLSPEELDKHLTAALIEARPIISLDNINSTLGGALLCQCATEPTLSLRILGKSETVRAPNIVTITVTGINATPRSDLTRRVAIARLAATGDNPEARRFRRDPIETVLRDRGRYVSAALIISRAYMLAGRPGLIEVTPWGSFEGFTSVVRAPLLWLGQPDVVTSMRSSQEEDPERQDLVEFIAAFAAGPAGRGVVFTAKQIVHGNGDENGLNSADHGAWRARYDAIDRIIGANNVARGLGNWLNRHKDKPIDGFKIVKAGVDRVTKVSLWGLEKVKNKRPRRGGATK